MALTRINSNIAGSFLQPEIGSVVTILADPMLDWLRVGQTVFIEEGGIYKVLSNTGFSWELKLETAKSLPGQVVTVELIRPINQEGSETFWAEKEF